MRPEEARPSAAIAFHCPACQQLVRVVTPVGPFYLQPGYPLACGHCGAIVAVTLTVVVPGPRHAQAPEDRPVGPRELEACPTRQPLSRRGRGGGGTCRCVPRCAQCGFGPHAAVHGPRAGERPGSRPYDHAYHPEDPHA
jgi:hypothetical protein